MTQPFREIWTKDAHMLFKLRLTDWFSFFLAPQAFFSLHHAQSLKLDSATCIGFIFVPHRLIPICPAVFVAWLSEESVWGQRHNTCGPQQTSFGFCQRQKLCKTTSFHGHECNPFANVWHSLEMHPQTKKGGRCRMWQMTTCCFARIQAINWNGTLQNLFEGLFTQQTVMNAYQICCSTNAMDKQGWNVNK